MPNQNPTVDTTNWGAVNATAWNNTAGYAAGVYVTVQVLGQDRLFRSRNQIAEAVATPNPNPPDDTTNWEAITTVNWDETQGYAQGTYTVRGGTLYRSTATIPTPTGGTSHIPYASWNNFNSGLSPNNASGTIGGADYYAGSGTTGNYRASLFVNASPLTTGANYQAITTNNAPPGNYRLTYNPPGGSPVSITGTIDIRQPDNAGRRAIVVSPSIGQSARSQDMIDAFGSATPSAGGTWDLEQVTTTPGTHPAPENDSANWEAVTPTAFNANQAYSQDDVVSFGGNNYAARNAISAPSATPNTAPASDPTNWQFIVPTAWDENAAYNQGDVVSYLSNNYEALNNISAPSAVNAILTEGGQQLETEGGDPLELE